jgi:hypothetical protein
MSRSSLVTVWSNDFSSREGGVTTVAGLRDGGGRTLVSSLRNAQFCIKAGNEGTMVQIVFLLAVTVTII